MGRKRKEVDTSTYAGKLAVRLRALREKKGLTVDELADQSGVSRTTIFNWECADHSPINEDFIKISSILGIKLPKIISGE